MKKLLHIIASPREDESRTLEIAQSFLETFRAAHQDWVIDELNLTKEKLPPLSQKRVDGKYVLLQGKELFGDLKESWEEIVTHINRFLSADLYLISSPMWNFGIPYTLKQYIDVIVQPKYLFRYTKSGVEGLAKNKKMVIIASRGGDYHETPALDFQEPYLRTIFGFCGITDINSIIAEPMDMGKELERERVDAAKMRAQNLASKV